MLAPVYKRHVRWPWGGMISGSYVDSRDDEQDDGLLGWTKAFTVYVRIIHCKRSF